MANKTHSATTGHPDPLANEPAPLLIVDMIRTLVPSGNRKAIIALFEHQTTWNTIKGWRKGRRRAPQWAIDLCARRLAHSARLHERACAAVGAIVGNHVPNIRAWHARQKEKGRSKAAPDE